MLDAMVGFSRISPISVAPPWQSALAELERREDIKGLRIAYVSDIAGIGVEAEIDAICRDAAPRFGKLGAQVEEIEFDAGDGRAPYQTWRGFWMVGQQYQRLAQIEQFGPNLNGNVEAGLKLTALDFAAAEQTRQEVFHRFRKLFERFDVLLTPAAPVKPYPVEMNFPDTINGTQIRKLHRLDRAGVSDHARQPAGRDRAGRPVAGWIAGRHADRGAALRGAADLARRALNPPREQRRRPPLAADSEMKHTLDPPFWESDNAARVLARFAVMTNDKHCRSGSRTRSRFWRTAPSAASWCRTAASSNWCSAGRKAGDAGR